MAIEPVLIGVGKLALEQGGKFLRAGSTLLAAPSSIR